MQATQPLRTFQLKAGIVAFLAVAIFVAAVIAASVLPSLGKTSAGTTPRAGVTIPHDDWANAGAGTSGFTIPHDGSANTESGTPLTLPADAGRDPGQRGVHANTPE